MSYRSKPRKKRSILWTMPKNEFQELVSSCDSYINVLKALNLCTRGSGFKRLKDRIAADSIDDSHIRARPQNAAALLSKTYTDEEVFVEHSHYLSGSHLKRRLIRAGLEEVCSCCKLGPEWNGLFLSLQLDHINGTRTDNRKENLRLLCPNCHSQTETFSGKKAKH